MTAYKGIDYGSGQTNVDHDSGIRYGVINQNEVLQAWADSSEPYYPPACPHCGSDIDQNIYDKGRDGWTDDEDNPIKCPCCDHTLEERDFWNTEPSGYILNDGTYKASCDEYGDIFIVKSPYFTYAQFCSPCAPGACYLTTPLDKPDPDNRAYCFGHDWFEDEKAPYPVYSVETGEIVEP